MHLIPPSSSDAAVQKLVSYSMRILGSRIEASTSINSQANSDHIKQLLIKKV